MHTSFPAGRCLDGLTQGLPELVANFNCQTIAFLPYKMSVSQFNRGHECLKPTQVRVKPFASAEPISGNEIKRIQPATGESGSASEGSVGLLSLTEDASDSQSKPVSRWRMISIFEGFKKRFC